MPIVDVEIVCASREAFDRHDARALADGVGRVLGAAPGTAWVRLRWLPRAQYAENDTPWTEPIGPVFVTLLLARLPDDGTLAAQVSALTAEVARWVGVVSDPVHLEILPPAAGRQAFGGRLVGRP